MKRPLYVVLHGGIGTGSFAQGFPMIEVVLKGLSTDFDVTVFSHSPFPNGYQCAPLRLKTPPAFLKFGLLRWAYLSLQLLWYMGESRHGVVYAIWGYPAGFLAVLLTKITGWKSVVHLFGGDAAGVRDIDFGILHHPSRRAMVRWAYRNTDRLLTLSGFQAHQLAVYGIQVNAEVVHWGPVLPDPMRVRSAPSLYEELHLLHVGHLTPVKDQETLLLALCEILRVRTARLRIIGIDTMNGAIQRRAEELGIAGCIDFVGVVPFGEMPAHYTWAHALLHTSVSEGQPMAVTEAIAHGVLVVGTRVGILFDWPETLGLVCEVKDHASIASALILAASDPDKWNTRVSTARAWIQQHDARWTLAVLSDVLETP